MEEFNKRAAMRGATVCTRDGHPARILAFDLEDGPFCIVAAYKDGEKEIVEEYDQYGFQCVNDDGLHPVSWNDDLMMSDDDYLEKLERGEYDHIEDNLEMVGKPDHIGESAEKVEDPRSLGDKWLNDTKKAISSLFEDLERSLDIERQKYELSKLKHEADMLELERIPENYDYWRRMYAGMAMQAIIQEDPQELAYNHAIYAVTAADSLIEELKKTK